MTRINDIQPVGGLNLKVGLRPASRAGRQMHALAHTRLASKPPTASPSATSAIGQKRPKSLRATESCPVPGRPRAISAAPGRTQWGCVDRLGNFPRRFLKRRHRACTGVKSTDLHGVMPVPHHPRRPSISPRCARSPAPVGSRPCRRPKTIGAWLAARSSGRATPHVCVVDKPHAKMTFPLPRLS